MENSYGLTDYPVEVDGDGLRGSGPIKGNVHKLVANRLGSRLRGTYLEERRWNLASSYFALFI